MTRRQIQKVLEEVSASLQNDSGWRAFASKPMPQGPMVEWIRTNRPEIATKFATLSAEECLSKGLIGAVVAFGGLMSA